MIILITGDIVESLKEIKKRKLKELGKRLNKNKMEKKIEVKDDGFDEKVLEQSKKVPVVVDFWAPWCAPCLMLGPTLEKLVEEYDGRFVLAKLNVDESPRVSRRYGIMSIPCVKMFKGGEMVDEFIGALPETSVKQWLDRNLGEQG